MKRLEHIKLCCPATAYTEDEFSVLGLCYKLINKMNDVVDELNETTGSVTELSTDVSELRTEHNALVGAVEETAGEINESITNINTRVDNVSDQLEAVENEFADAIVIDEFTSSEELAEYTHDVHCKFPVLTIKIPSAQTSTYQFFVILTINGIEYAFSYLMANTGGYPRSYSIGWTESGGNKMLCISSLGKVFAESEDYEGKVTYGSIIFPRNAIIDNIKIETTRDIPIGTHFRLEASQV